MGDSLLVRIMLNRTCYGKAASLQVPSPPLSPISLLVHLSITRVHRQVLLGIASFCVRLVLVLSRISSVLIRTSLF